MLALLPLLASALSGEGPALLLHPADRPPDPVVRPGEPLLPGEDDQDDPTVLAAGTSGSTGEPKAVLLPASALLAAASASHDRLGGPGGWLLALPLQHVAGMQVLVRSLVSRVTPQVLDLSAGWSAQAFADAAAGLDAARRYTALVPTQLARLVATGGSALDAAAGLDAVLVGGAPLPAVLAGRAADAGIRVVSSYGTSETCGGCVYDGVPLDGVAVGIDGADGDRIRLAGPVLARGYRGAPPARGGAGFETDAAGTRWVRIDDAGLLEGGRLRVLGRLDDTIMTGGVNVPPGPVEAALLTMSGVQEAVVIGVPDPDWGQRVVAVVVPAAGAVPPSLELVRQVVAQRVARHAAPRQLLVLDRMPLRGPGKPDRSALAVRAAR